MIVNFRARRISRATCKLAQTITLNKKKKKKGVLRTNKLDTANKNQNEWSHVPNILTIDKTVLMGPVPRLSAALDNRQKPIASEKLTGA